MRFHFILLAGGSGSRVGGEIPKQFLDFRGRPVFIHSLNAFLRWLEAGRKKGRVIFVCRPDWIERARELIKEHGEFTKSDADISIQLEPGRETRHGSQRIGVLRAMESDTDNADNAGDADVLLIHDAARPFLEIEELERLAAHMRDNPDCEVASLATPVTDTIVRGVALPGKMLERLDRSELFAVKTPQALRVSAARRIIDLPEASDFTDLLSWAAAGGIQGDLVRASERNHKLTTRADFESGSEVNPA